MIMSGEPSVLVVEEEEEEEVNVVVVDEPHDAGRKAWW
jgi:hypothetical protein